MRFRQIFGFLGIGMLPIGSSCQQDHSSMPAPLTMGRLVKVENTCNCCPRDSRPR